MLEQAHHVARTPLGLQERDTETAIKDAHLVWPELGDHHLDQREHDEKREEPDKPGNRQYERWFSPE